MWQAIVAGVALAARSAQEAQRETFSPAAYRLEPRYSVSLIIPALNESQYIDGMLTSARNQTEPVSEIIVVDSSAHDEGTSAVARSHGAMVLPSEPGSISKSRNVGAAAASGDVLLFVDADVVMSPFVVEDLVSSLEGGAILAHPKAATYYDAPGYSTILYPLQALFRPNAQVGGWCIAMGAGDFNAVGGFDEDCQLGTCHEAWELSARVLGMFGPGTVVGVSTPCSTSGRRFKKFGLTGGLGTMVTPVR